MAYNSKPVQSLKPDTDYPECKWPIIKCRLRNPDVDFLERIEGVQFYARPIIKHGLRNPDVDFLECRWSLG